MSSVVDGLYSPDDCSTKKSSESVESESENFSQIIPMKNEFWLGATETDEMTLKGYELNKM